MIMTKAEYWQNRKAGKRGQGEKPNLIAKSYSVSEWTIKKIAEKSLRRYKKNA